METLQPRFTIKLWTSDFTPDPLPSQNSIYMHVYAYARASQIPSNLTDDEIPVFVTLKTTEP